MIKKTSLSIMVLFYFGAGINHFIKPVSYYKLIPAYLPDPIAINIVSGAAEILFAVMLVFSKTREMAAYGIVLLLIAFMPAHIQMIQDGFCLDNGYCLPEWVTWIRLFPLQFLLMWWAWSNRK